MPKVCRVSDVKKKNVYIQLAGGRGRESISLLQKAIWGHLEKLEEKAMAPHSNTLAWKIPWTEEPGGLPSMGSHRVGHERSDLAAAAEKLEAYCHPDALTQVRQA